MGDFFCGKKNKTQHSSQINQINQINIISNMAKKNHSKEEREQVLKNQQHRLLLMRHSVKCPHGNNGNCPVDVNCWNMKQLLKHINFCNEPKCKVWYCVSSRNMLSHYSKCNDPKCLVCVTMMMRDAVTDEPRCDAVKRRLIEKDEPMMSTK